MKLFNKALLILNLSSLLYSCSIAMEKEDVDNSLSVEQMQIQKKDRRGIKRKNIENHGGSVLIKVCKKGDINELKKLLEEGADVDLTGINKQTPLMFAAMEGHKEIVELLLNTDANVHLVSVRGETAFLLAACKGHKEIVGLLLDANSNIDQKDNWGTTALMYAAIDDFSDTVSFLIDNDADLDLEDNHGKTALDLAPEGSKSEKLLLQATGRLITVIESALKKDDKSEVLRLLELITDIDEKNDKDQTILMLAAKYGQEEIVEMLLDNGADVTLQDASGDTALTLAAKSDQLEIVSILLDEYRKE